MKITIEAEPKEIADLVVALQDRHISDYTVSIGGKELSSIQR